MKRSLPFIAIILLIASAAWGMQQQPNRDAAPPPPANTRFAYIDVYLDPANNPLASYQIELTASATTKILSLEGGEHPAFKSPPFYDPAALSHNHIILAAYQTGNDLPNNRTRIARIHVQADGPIDAQVKLIVAGNREARPIDAAVTVIEGEAR